MAERANKGDTTRDGNLYQHQHVGVDVKDINVALQSAMRAGAQLAIPIRRVRTNSGLEIKQAYIKGPDGETIELTEIIARGLLKGYFGLSRFISLTGSHFYVAGFARPSS